MNAQLLDSVTSPIDTRAVAATDDGLRAAEEERAVSISATGGRGDGEHAAAADPPPGADRRRHARPCRRAEEHSRKKNLACHRVMRNSLRISPQARSEPKCWRRPVRAPFWRASGNHAANAE